MLTKIKKAAFKATKNLTILSICLASFFGLIKLVTAFITGIPALVIIFSILLFSGLFAFEYFLDDEY